MDWESAYVQCPPFGVGKGPYGWETPQMLADLERDLKALQEKLNGAERKLLERYLKSGQRYLYGCCRYYYYRGMLHGTSESVGNLDCFVWDGGRKWMNQRRGRPFMVASPSPPGDSAAIYGRPTLNGGNAICRGRSLYCYALFRRASRPLWVKGLHLFL